MPNVYIPTLKEFINEHGQGVFVTDPKLRGYRRYVCRDGAFYTPDGGSLNLPPGDEIERTALQIAYWRTKLNQEAEDFAAYKKAVFQQAHLSAQYGNLPGPPDAAEVTRTLQAGKLRVGAYQMQIAKLQARLDELTGLPERRKAIEEAAQRRKATARDIEQSLNSVMLDSGLTYPVPDEDQGDSHE